MGKVAVVTGGSSGIGKGIARAFAAEGCSVILAGRRADRLAAAAAELSTTGSEVLAVPTDVTVEDQVVRLFHETMRRFGCLDILVNSAGAFDGGPLDEIELDSWSRTLSTNLTGPFLCTREAFRIMKVTGGGRIINIGSIAAQRPREYSAPYTVSKHAVWALTQCTSLEGREFGIVASCLHPGNTLVERRNGGTNLAGWHESDEPMIATEDVARVALLMATLPAETNLLEAIVLPNRQLYLGRG